jgi:hypothetical protein
MVPLYILFVELTMRSAASGYLDLNVFNLGGYHCSYFGGERRSIEGIGGSAPLSDVLYLYRP